MNRQTQFIKALHKIQKLKVVVVLLSIHNWLRRTIMGGTSFKNKYFEEKKVTYVDVEKQMLAMKGKLSQDRQKMFVIYFLANIIIGGRKSGEGASHVDTFFLRVFDDLDVCQTFPWGRYAFEQNLKDVSSFLEKCDGVAPLKAIPRLRKNFQETIIGVHADCPQMCKMQYKRKDIESILVATPAAEELLKRIMAKESCWADDEDDASVHDLRKACKCHRTVLVELKSAKKKRIYWEKWEKLCLPREEGGIGFRMIHEFNLALLAKQLCRLVQYPDLLVARVLRGKYY
ncbi:hypothetical protein N665_1594s0005 [Sinapis alba]|nr:hypothetical protein N665_1594s0005 [Sinapis alba]